MKSKEMRLTFIENLRSIAAGCVLALSPIVLITTFLAPSASAQTTSGDIAGTIKDSLGAAIPNVSITVTNEKTGTQSTTKTNAAGQFQVQNLLPGLYDIQASASGFSNSTLKALTVVPNSASTANLSLSVGSVSTSIEVTGGAGVVLDTTTQNLTQTFDAEQLQALPTAAVGGAGQNGVLNVSLLAPGVASSGGIGIGVGPSIGGQRPRNNNFEIEGIDNNNKAVTGPLVYVPNDAVGDFSLITTQFSPEFGHSSGGQFNTNVISGTNTFHGKVYEYFQNRNLNAASGPAGGKTFPIPGYDNNRYGAEVGGPILHNKLFFFVNYERNTINQVESTHLCTPTASGLATLNSLGAAYGLNTNNLAQYAKYIPAATTTGPNGTGIDAAQDIACGNESTGPPFLTVYNTTGPAYQADGTTPQTNIPLGNYLGQGSAPVKFWALTTSVDYTINPSDSLRLRYIYNNQTSIDDVAALPTFYAAQPFKWHLFALSEFHTFSPNLVNEFRIGFNRYDNVLTAGNFSFPGLDSFPNLYFYDQGSIDVGPDDNAPQFTIQNLYQVTDNISWTKGKHTLKFGFDGRKYISPQGFTQRARGDYEWSNLSDYLHDLGPDPNGFGERSTGNETYYGDQTALYGYANDTWRASDKLTLNFGLRYEFTSVPSGEREQSLNSLASVPSLITFGAPQPTYTSFAPRFGVVFAPDSKTSIRAGYGIAYDVLFDNLGTLSFPPQLSQTNDVGTNPAYPFSLSGFLAAGGLPPGTGSGVTQLSKAVAIATTAAYVPNQVAPYSENYTLTMQREISRGLVVEIGYIGTRGIHLPTQIQLNVQAPVTAQNALFTELGNTALTPNNGTTLTQLKAIGNIIPAYKAAGFVSKITSYQPWSGSNYNGLITNLQGHLHNLQMNLSWTWSKAMDNATAEVFSTVLTPRRPEDSQNLNQDYSRSALDRTHRVTLEADYNYKGFNGHNWLLRNLVANWVVAPIYTYESPEYATALSGVNSNLNGDTGAAIDRPLINLTGVKGTGSGVNAITNGTGDTIGYQAINPKAYYIEAGPGTLPNASRNTLPIRPINNIDLTLNKRLTFHDRYSFEFGVQAFNLANHAQYIPGSVDNVNGPGYVSSYSFQTVSNALFNQPQKEFNNNARTLQLTGKFSF
jgi:Carboxypeptidase regulatory-like domain/TonB dependent receptor